MSIKQLVEAQTHDAFTPKIELAETLNSDVSLPTPLSLVKNNFLQRDPVTGTVTSSITFNGSTTFNKSITAENININQNAALKTSKISYRENDQTKTITFVGDRYVFDNYITLGKNTASGETGSIITSNNNLKIKTNSTLDLSGDYVNIYAAGAPGSYKNLDLGASNGYVVISGLLGTKVQGFINTDDNGSAEAVGSNTQPMYINSDGNFEAISSTIGSSVKPIYMASGELTASSSTIGASDKPIFLSNGTITQSSANIGSTSTFMYMENGQLKAGIGFNITDVTVAN